MFIQLFFLLDQNWSSLCSGTKKNALAKSITVKYLAFGLSSFSNVCGSGTRGSRSITALFTACKSCTILHPVDEAAFFTGNRGLLHAASEHSLMTPASSKSLTIVHL